MNYNPVNEYWTSFRKLKEWEEKIKKIVNMADEFYDISFFDTEEIFNDHLTDEFLYNALRKKLYEGKIKFITKDYSFILKPIKEDEDGEGVIDFVEGSIRIWIDPFGSESTFDIYINK